MKLTKYFLASVLLMFSSSALAATMTFVLGDHEDGSLYDGSTNPYGVRLDQYHQIFSVGDNLAGSFAGGPVLLTFDPMDLAAGALISGVVVDTDTGAAWDLVYTLSGLTAAENGGFFAQSGAGSLTEQMGTGMVALMGMSNGSEVFEFDNDGHRLDGDPGVGWVGRGWLDGHGTNDFLVTATVVPVPAAFWMFGAGLITLLRLRQR